MNEVAKRVLETGGIKKQELMEEYALNRFEADILILEQPSTDEIDKTSFP